MLKQGQCIGMGDTQVSLLVEIQSIHGDKMRGWVVNGCWEFDYSLSTGRMEFDPPSGHEIQHTSVLFTDPYPRTLRGYGEVIGYMNDHLKSSWFTRFMFRASMRAAAVGCWIHEAPTRFVNAVQGLRNGWNGPLTVPSPVDYDDDIPF